MFTRAMFIMLVASAAVFLHGCSEGSQGSPEDEPSPHEYIQGNKTNVQASTTKQPTQPQVPPSKPEEAAGETTTGGADNRGVAQAPTRSQGSPEDEASSDEYIQRNKINVQDCEFHESINDGDADVVIAKCEVTPGGVKITIEANADEISAAGDPDLGNINKIGSGAFIYGNFSTTVRKSINDGVTLNYHVNVCGRCGENGSLTKTITRVTKTTMMTMGNSALNYCRSAAIEHDVEGCLGLGANWRTCEDVNPKCKTRYYPAPTRCVSTTPAPPANFTVKCGGTHYHCDCSEYIP